jgi:hypothetical protein
MAIVNDVDMINQVSDYLKSTKGLNFTAVKVVAFTRRPKNVGESDIEYHNDFNRDKIIFSTDSFTAGVKHSLTAPQTDV